MAPPKARPGGCLAMCGWMPASCMHGYHCHLAAGVCAKLPILLPKVPDQPRHAERWPQAGGIQESWRSERTRQPELRRGHLQPCQPAPACGKGWHWTPDGALTTSACETATQATSLSQLLLTSACNEPRKSEQLTSQTCRTEADVQDSSASTARAAVLGAGQPGCCSCTTRAATLS